MTSRTVEEHSKFIDVNDIRSARDRIAPFIKRTHLERSESLSSHIGTNIFVKYELFQRTGSFKVRGAFNKMLSMTEDERSRGVVAVSGGNHAQAVAYAANTLGVSAAILMPENTPQVYVDATRGYGAAVDLRPSIAEAFAAVETYQDKGMAFVHPFDDPLVMAGQGTLGLEILEDVPDVTDVIVSIGGGGLAAGVAVAVKASNPGVRVFGVETEGADAMSQALAAGHPVQLPAITSIAKTLGAPSVSEATLAMVKENFESVTVVSDREAVEAMTFILERLKVITEPAASCTLAAAEKLRSNFGSDGSVVLILCGGNTGVDDLCRYFRDFS